MLSFAVNKDLLSEGIIISKISKVSLSRISQVLFFSHGGTKVIALILQIIKFQLL
jgi:hypothetical protein